MRPKAIDVKVLNNYELEIKFDNNERKIFDVKPYFKFKIFNDLKNYEEFKKVDCEIYSVSTDTHFVHKAWHDSSKRISKIEYPMLADPTHALSKDFEVLIEEDGLAERGTFVVNPEGKIVAYEVNAGNVGRNADELLRKVQACQFVYTHGDEVCPAKWEPGKETLKPSLDLVGQL